LYRQYPNHPGIAHYLIHTFDYTSLAERGMPYARAYADIAPSVPHVQHMPSHIFSRVGDWPAMVESNLASYQAARQELQATTLDIGTYDALHALDYLVFGHLQQGQHQAAKQRVDEVAAIRKVNVENFVAAYAFAAIPARYALERGQWQEAAALQLSPADLAWDKFPQAEAILVFARGLGAARSGNPDAARADVERLQALQAAMRQSNLGYWADQAESQIKAVNAWIAQAEHRPDDALRLMREAADLEEASDKHPVTPGNVVPSRELLAELLLVQKQPAEALAEFERSLQRDPNRLRATQGAMEAATAAGNAEAARRYEQKVAVLTAAGDAQQ
jgi:tetratricopeptide (TPR) repeat protein